MAKRFQPDLTKLRKKVHSSVSDEALKSTIYLLAENHYATIGKLINGKKKKK